MTTKLLLAGSGGQGVILMGRLLAEAGMLDGRRVTFFPSYGAEVRGGTAHCHVIMSESEIFSPTVESADVLVVMNQPSYDRFAARLVPEGTMFIEQSLVHPRGDNPRIVGVPTIEMARELGNPRVGNMVMLGAVAGALGLATEGAIGEALRINMTGKKAALLEVNLEAVREGLTFGAGHAPLTL